MTKIKNITDEEIELLMEKRKKSAIEEQKRQVDEQRKMLDTLKKKLREKHPDLANLEIDEAKTLKCNKIVFVHSYDNLKTFIEECNKYKGHFWHSDFSDLNLTNLDGSGKIKNALDDNVGAMIREDIIRVFGMNNRFLEKDIDTAIRNLCNKYRKNEVLEVLDELQWDGKKRMENFFIDTVGAIDEEYTREATKKWFYAAVKRVYEPGCKFDNMIILQDPTQGTGKTNTVELLARYLDLGKYCLNTCSLDPNNKDTYVLLNDAWIVLWDELGNSFKFESSTMKNLLSKTCDNFRDPYEKGSKDHPRKCVVIGTTNEENFLKDYTGDMERRYWIFSCEGVCGDEKYWKEWNAKYNQKYFKQVWAEAVYLYKNNPNMSYTVLTDSIREKLGERQIEFRTTEKDPYQDIIIETLDKIKCPRRSKDNRHGTFDTSKTFVAAFKEAYEGNVFAEESGDELTKIPEKWVALACKEVLHFDKGNLYLRALISKSWKKEFSSYNGKSNMKVFRKIVAFDEKN